MQYSCVNRTSIVFSGKKLFDSSVNTRQLVYCWAINMKIYDHLLISLTVLNHETMFVKTSGFKAKID